MRKLIRSGVVALALCSAVGWGFTSAAADEKKPAMPSHGQTAGQPEMTEEQRKMMEMMEKMGTPGKQHAMLASWAGDWDCDVKMIEPGVPPEASKMTAKREMMMDGRCLQSKWMGDMMGSPFQGLEMMGYDNGEEMFWSIWMDNMSTGAMMQKGKADASGKVITMTGQSYDGMTKSMATMKSVITVISPDQTKFEMFKPGPTGAETKCMEITCTRKKAA